MIELNPGNIPQKVKDLFKHDQPQAKRCFAVLDGITPYGRIMTDNPEEPRWAAVQEPFDRTIFFGGDLDRYSVSLCIDILRQVSDILVGIWFNDPIQALLPPNPDYTGTVLEFYDRPVTHSLAGLLEKIPGDCQLIKLDAETVLKTEWGAGDVEMAGGMENWLENFLGFGLLWKDEVLAEAMSGPPSRGIFEPGVFTKPEHRGKGYGTLVSAMLVQEIEAFGGASYWNCAKQNLASAAIARKLGYSVEKEYRLVGWQKTE